MSNLQDNLLYRIMKRELGKNIDNFLKTSEKTYKKDYLLMYLNKNNILIDQISEYLFLAL